MKIVSLPVSLSKKNVDIFIEEIKKEDIDFIALQNISKDVYSELMREIMKLGFSFKKTLNISNEILYKNRECIQYRERDIHNSSLKEYTFEDFIIGTISLNDNIIIKRKQIIYLQNIYSNDQKVILCLDSNIKSFENVETTFIDIYEEIGFDEYTINHKTNAIVEDKRLDRNSRIYIKCFEPKDYKLLLKNIFPPINIDYGIFVEIE